MKKIKSNGIFENLVMIILSLMCIIPFFLIIAISFSSEKDIIQYGYSIIPKNFDLSAYKYVFKNPTAIINAYKVTAFITFFGTALSVFLMALIAYPLSKSYLKGRKYIAFYVFFTMLFSGGLVSSYIINTRYLNLNNTIWIFILPTLISPWHIFMMRTFFSQLPNEVFESAKIDGAGEFSVFIKFALPMSKPVLATVALLGALTRWNDWYTSMLYITKENLMTLQYILQRILLNIKLIQEQSDSLTSLGISVNEIPAETTRMAMVVIATGPMMFVFPFFQKYFAKGLTVGAVKG